MFSKWYIVFLVYFGILAIGVAGVTYLYGIDAIIRGYGILYNLSPSLAITVPILISLSFIAGFFVILDIRSRD